ncbi:C-type lectin domain family 2 member D-like [Pelodiscus sinensis]|uniref:C-type lectin domain family 2 member D-like n=1 Tax=Pelodiscus sinensis TaxID=13735 RepID=UPI003F6B1AF5
MDCVNFSPPVLGVFNKDNLLHHKDKSDYWIGLRKDQGSTWKWANGTEFNHLFVIGGDGGCAYLNKDIGVSSLRCTSERRWICSKPKALTAAKETPAGRGS